MPGGVLIGEGGGIAIGANGGRLIVDNPAECECCGPGGGGLPCSICTPNPTPKQFRVTFMNMSYDDGCCVVPVPSLGFKNQRLTTWPNGGPNRTFLLGQLPNNTCRFQHTSYAIHDENLSTCPLSEPDCKCCNPPCQPFDLDILVQVDIFPSFVQVAANVGVNPIFSGFAAWDCKNPGPVGIVNAFKEPVFCELTLPAEHRYAASKGICLVEPLF